MSTEQQSGRAPLTIQPEQVGHLPIGAGSDVCLEDLPTARGGQLSLGRPPTVSTPGHMHRLPQADSRNGNSQAAAPLLTVVSDSHSAWVKECNMPWRS